MATVNDWNTRIARVQEQFNIQLPALITNYELKTRAVGDIMEQVRKLEDEKGKMQHEMKLAEQEASTADRAFIEKRATFPDPFKPSRIYTIQDFTFFLFFMSYCIFVIAIAMVVQEKTKVILGGLVALLVIVVLIYRYI